MRNFNLITPSQFNEKIYSLKNSYNEKVARQFLSEQMIYKKEKGVEKENHEDILALYRVFQNNLLHFIDYLKIGESDLEKAIIVEYLFHNGYLFDSTNTKPENKLFYNLGVNPILGDINYISMTRFYYDLFKNRFDYPLEYPCYKGNNNFIAKHSLPNNQINLATYNGLLYGIDLLTKKMYTFKNKFQMGEISDSKTLLRYKPYSEIITKDLIVGDIKAYLELFKSNVNDLALTEAECNNIRNSIYYILDINHQLVESFGKESHDLCQEINNKMLSKKR